MLNYIFTTYFQIKQRKMDKYSRTIISPQVFLSKYLQFDWQKWNRVRDITSRLSDYNLLFLENYFWKEYNQTVPEIFSRAQIGDERSLVLALYVKNKNYSLNKKDDTGKTVLHWILQTCSNMLFNFFLKNGADPLSKDNFGQSVVTICCINGLTDKLRLIIDHISKSTLNEECTRKDSYGMTCLHYLTKNAYNGGEHRESLREIVIKSEVDINIKVNNINYFYS